MHSTAQALGNENVQQSQRDWYASSTLQDLIEAAVVYVIVGLLIACEASMSRQMPAIMCCKKSNNGHCPHVCSDAVDMGGQMMTAVINAQRQKFAAWHCIVLRCMCCKLCIAQSSKLLHYIETF